MPLRDEKRNYNSARPKLRWDMDILLHHSPGASKYKWVVFHSNTTTIYWKIK
jgi:hypothetical protein